MLPLVGGEVGQSIGNDRISDNFGLREGNNSFGYHVVRVMFLF